MAHIVCEGCQITLMYAYGAQSVKCAVCNFVTHVPSCQLRFQAQASSPAPQETQLSNTSAAQRTTVVVENPPSIDDEGNEVRHSTADCVLREILRRFVCLQVQNIAVGVKTEADV